MTKPARDEPHPKCVRNYTMRPCELLTRFPMERSPPWRAVRILTVLVGGLLLVGACLLRNNLSLLLIALGIIALSVIDLIDGSIWWLSEEWTADPESPTARIVAISSLILGALL